MGTCAPAVYERQSEIVLTGWIALSVPYMCRQLIQAPSCHSACMLVATPAAIASWLQCSVLLDGLRGPSVMPIGRALLLDSMLDLVMVDVIGGHCTDL
jgi:hypothetical protein